MIGDFTSFIPLAIEHSASDSFELRAGTLQGQLFEDVERRSFNGVEIVRELVRAKGMESNFCFPIVFTSLLGQNKRRDDYADKFWMGTVRYGISQTPQVWLDHQVVEQDGALVFQWDAVEELFSEGILNEMFEAYVSLLHQLSDDDALWRQPRLCLTPAAHLEQRAVINSVTASVPLDVLLHDLFLNQVPQRPNQPAIVSAKRVLSYEELGRRVSSSRAQPPWPGGAAQSAHRRRDGEGMGAGRGDPRDYAIGRGLPSDFRGDPKSAAPGSAR